MYAASTLSASALLVSLIPVVSPQARAAGRSLPTPPPSAVTAEPAWDDVAVAHLSLLQGDFVGMAREIKSALMRHPDDESVREDLLDLMDQAYGFGAGHIPADWKLPDELTSFEIGVKRRSNDDPSKASYYLFVTFDTPRPDLIERIQVIRYPGEVLIDKGTFNHEAMTGHSTGLGRRGLRGYVLGSDARADPVPDGLYLLNIEVKGKPPVHGWFTLHAMSASTAPEVLSPTPDQVYRTGSPRFLWQAYRSPELQPFEERKLMLRLFEGRGGWYDALWNDFAPSPDQGAYTLGEGRDDPALRPGAYELQFVFEERRRFGDLVISRQSARSLGFTVTE